MTRSHRNWHFWMWLVIAPLLVAGLTAGVLFRPSLPRNATQPLIAGEARP
jgi:hypothetical protein